MLLLVGDVLRLLQQQRQQQEERAQGKLGPVRTFGMLTALDVESQRAELSFKGATLALSTRLAGADPDRQLGDWVVVHGKLLWSEEEALLDARVVLPAPDLDTELCAQALAVRDEHLQDPPV